ncbi:MAG: nitrous oxide reductase [Aquificae bacterium]|nr:nitrous oxide reductase [Aquificota bacterium]
MRALFALFAFILLFSCETKPTPEPIRFGKDTCVWCRMAIVDAGFASELKTKKGKVYKFDAIECLGAFYLSGRVPKDEILAMWVSDYKQKELIRAESAHYLISPNIKSPMGLGIAAFEKEEDLKEALRIFGGRRTDWKGVLEYIREKWKDQLSHSHS